MDAKHFFDSIEYFGNLCRRNKLAVAHDFHFCSCSGIESLEGPLEEFRRKKAFFCVDDTNDGALFQGRGGGFYKKRTYTVFLMHRYEFGDMSDRRDKLAICRDLFSQLVSRMIVDADNMSNEQVYLETGNIMSRELGQYFMNGCTGLYFMIDVSEPVDLVFDNTQWIAD